MCDSASLFRLKEAQDALLGHQSRLDAKMVEERTASLRVALEQLAEAQRVAYLAQLDTVERLAILSDTKIRSTRPSHSTNERVPCGHRARTQPAALEVELILHASRMHDVGKIAVPDSILQKPSTLDGPEWAVMRRHAMIGSRILDNSSSALLQAGRVIALCHHERWDGSGYPNGTSGEAIPLWARICAVADVFDAVTSERPYKPAYSIEEALNILRNGRGTQFDPQIVDVFFDQLDAILEIVAVYCEPDEPID